jgi:mannose-6-phosphate isomerase
MTRVWGGRSLETNYDRPLPDDQPYGESWEISDREGEQSLISQGKFAGKSLHHLWSRHREEIFGEGLTGDRFPLLIKILDARDDLSIQVHPPQAVANDLGGDPKTEMWYIADRDPEAKLYIGLNEGTTRESFEQSLLDGTVEQQVHAVSPEIGESIFIPSGRLHAIGAGFLIYEIQQNSDTTYRVFDWNRMGLDGKRRDLHIAESLASINFNDFEPGMDQPDGDTLASCHYFVVDQLDLQSGDQVANKNDRFSIITVVSGELTHINGQTFKKGDFFILPRGTCELIASSEAKVLQTRIPDPVASAL